MPESPLFYEIASLKTEQINPLTKDIDIASTTEILEMINKEDSLLPEAVRREIANIAKAVDIISYSFRNGGRLFYFGAGTSGRLGVVDASECPPTFGTDPEMVQGFIAGGREALFVAQEGAEDFPENGEKDVENNGICAPDVVVGIAASGRTPYVRGALSKAKDNGCHTILISTTTHEEAEKLGMKADIYICPEVGPEVIAGSTRMKSGTAQKLVLNMLTTASMIRIGKTYGNIMVDLQQTNAKLKERSKRILMEITGVDHDQAAEFLAKSNYSVKLALVMIMADVEANEAGELLKKAGGFVKKAVNLSKP
jgi:N-acetylmuramic acid 6-phosphate etherase